ncbi:hypothetical protein [Streptomyces sp. NBC_00076]|uniref:hypothetical protein n=1 Tax=Streptomyces sp. NBC_00076 TaxID=2975642 RepID=UPI00325132C9
MAFWQEDGEIDAGIAYQKYDAMTDGELGISPKSANVTEFYKAILRTYDDLTIENAEDSPWASPVHCNEECVIVAISWSRKNEVADSLRSLARAHNLLTYDPQEEEIDR